MIKLGDMVTLRHGKKGAVADAVRMLKRSRGCNTFRVTGVFRRKDGTMFINLNTGGLWLHADAFNPTDSE